MASPRPSVWTLVSHLVPSTARHESHSLTFKIITTQCLSKKTKKGTSVSDTTSQKLLYFVRHDVLLLLVSNKSVSMNLAGSPANSIMLRKASGSIEDDIRTHTSETRSTFSSVEMGKRERDSSVVNPSQP